MFGVSPDSGDFRVPDNLSVRDFGLQEDPDSEVEGVLNDFVADVDVELFRVGVEPCDLSVLSSESDGEKRSLFFSESFLSEESDGREPSRVGGERGSERSGCYFCIHFLFLLNDNCGSRVSQL